MIHVWWVRKYAISKKTAKIFKSMTSRKDFHYLFDSAFDDSSWIFPYEYSQTKINGYGNWSIIWEKKQILIMITLSAL